MPREIERRYLLCGSPVLGSSEVSAGYIIDQGYFEDEAGAVVRIRARLALPMIAAFDVSSAVAWSASAVALRPGEGDDARVQCFETRKSGAGLVREEIERQIDAAAFRTLWPRTQGRRLSKMRRACVLGDLVWEIDTFLDRRLALAEVELAHESDSPALPPWLLEVLVREVTGEPAFANSELARHTQAPG